MNSFTIGHVQSLLVSTTTNNQCAFSNTFTTLRARGLSQHPAGTATLVVYIDSEGTISIGGSLVDSLPIATPTLLGIMYGPPPSPTNVNSSLSLGYNAIAGGTWSVAIGNDVLTSTNSWSQCNVAIGSLNLNNLTSGQHNTAIGQGSMVNLTTGSGNTGLGYQAAGGYNSNQGFQMGSNNIAIGNFAGSGADNAAVSNNIYIGPNTATSATGVSNSIMLGSGATSGVSNEFMISNINHLNIPALTTLADGTGTLMQWGGANVGWVQASGGTYNSVRLTALYLQSKTTIYSLTPGGVTSYTIPSGINIVNIEAVGGGAAGNSATYFGQNTGGEDIYDGGGGGGLGQFEI